MSRDIRILLLADSHLGFDLPCRPRSARRRRGHDFLANYAAALEPALAGGVDLVVHGGDVFDRPDVSADLAWQAFAPLVRVADRGVPVFIVPGNHERSGLPHHDLASHRCVHVFDRPRTFVVEIRGVRIALSGFPCERRDVRARFPDLLERTGSRREPAAHRLLCMHQCVEGATVGPADFTFTYATDVIRAADIPAEFTAVLSGHIHRRQVLTNDLHGRPLAAPVLYPGSLERTSFAEMAEPKGFMIVHVSAEECGGRVGWEFRSLPARPMIRQELRVESRDAAQLESAVRALLAAAPADAVIRIQLAGTVTDAHWRVVSAARLRTFAPAGMNIEIRGADGFRRMRASPGSGQASRRPPRRPDAGMNFQLELET